MTQVQTTQTPENAPRPRPTATAKSFAAYLGMRQRTRSEPMKISRIMRRLKEEKLPVNLPELWALFQQLEAQGYGHVILSPTKKQPQYFTLAKGVDIHKLRTALGVAEQPRPRARLRLLPKPAQASAHTYIFVEPATGTPVTITVPEWVKPTLAKLLMNERNAK